MFEEIMYAISIIFLFIGLISVINIILFKILVPKKSGSYIIVVPQNATGEDVGGLAYYLSFTLGLLGMFSKVHIRVIDCGMSKETKDICNNLIKNRSNIEICDAKDFYKQMEFTNKNS